jgi:hypothetical protein
MNKTISYVDLWALLRRLGYDCDRVIDDGKHRVCENATAGSVLTLADYAADQVVHPQTLYGVRLELDNFGLVSREEFDRWVDRRAKANAAKANGSNRTTAAGKLRRGVSSGSQ